MNLPNKLSTMRICMVPLFIAFFFLPYYWSAFAAVAVFVLAALTDFLDGYIARKYNMVTDLGKLLDPIADKMLVCAALFAVTSTNTLGYMVDFQSATIGQIVLAVGGTVILSRELLISAVRMIAAAKGKVVQANILGKIKTVLQDVSLPLLIIMDAQADLTFSKNAYGILWYISIVIFGMAVIMTLASGVVYLVQNRKVFTQND